jgi:hypothetical protein
VPHYLGRKVARRLAGVLASAGGEDRKGKGQESKHHGFSNGGPGLLQFLLRLGFGAGIEERLAEHPERQRRARHEAHPKQCGATGFRSDRCYRAGLVSLAALSPVNLKGNDADQDVDQSDENVSGSSQGAQGRASAR